MIGFHTWHCKCEGVSRDSGCGHEEFHLMHDMKYSILDFIFSMKCSLMMYAIACAFRWGVALVGEFFYWVLLTLSWDSLSGIRSVQGDEAPTRL